MSIQLKIKQDNVPWGIADVIIFIFLEMMLFYILLSPKLKQFLELYIENSSYYIFFLYILQTLITLSVLYLLTVFRYKVDAKSFGFIKIPFSRSLKYVFSIWFLTFILLVILGQIFMYFFESNLPGFSPQIDRIPLFGQNPIGYISLIISALVIAPFTEELVFRGFILQGLLTKFSPLNAILISSTLFAILHFEFSSIIPIFILGNMLGWLYYKQKSIYGCFMFHAINNTIAVIAEFVLSKLMS